jgi:hypothetical protein
MKSKQETILVDDDVYYEINRHNWTYSKLNPWATTVEPRKKTNMAEFVLRYNKHEKKSGYTIDHIHQNHRDCRIQNLRYADKTAQAQNRPKTKKEATSRFIGVNPVRNSSKWRARLCFKRQVYYQVFDLEVHAAHHYNLLAKQLYSQPMLNVINESTANFPISSFETSKVQKPHSKQGSKYRGVNFSHGTWYSRICVMGKMIQKGFKTEKEAALHYNKLAKVHRKRPTLNVL